MQLMTQLDHLANRGYTEGFYRRHVPSEYQNYADGNMNTQQQFVGEALHFDPHSGWMTVEVRNRFSLGDTLELITPQGNHSFTLTTMENEKGQHTEVAPGSGHVVKIPLQGVTVPNNGQYAMLMRHNAL